MGGRWRLSQSAPWELRTMLQMLMHHPREGTEQPMGSQETNSLLPHSLPFSSWSQAATCYFLRPLRMAD